MLINILFGFLLGLIIGVFICMWVLPKYRIKKVLNKKSASDIYMDYVCVERMLVIRLFPSSYETEALEGVTSNDVLEYGNIGDWMYYLIQL